MKERKKMPAATRNLLLEIDAYASVLKSKRGNEPSFIGVTDIQFKRLFDSSEFWGNKLWRTENGGLEYNGIPVRVVKHVEAV